MVTSVLQDWQYLFDVRSLLMLKKMSLKRNDLTASCLMTSATIAIVVQSDRRSRLDKCLNKF